MAFQPLSTGQERQNRKLLEQLEEQKKRLRQQGSAAAAPALPPTSVAPVNSLTSAVTAASSTHQSLLAEPLHMTPAQRAALQHAHANSVGYFITQDSSFGNLILPVLPRFIEK